MKARPLIGGIALEPEALTVIGRAFDRAWVEIAGNFGSDPQVIEAARLRLANAFLCLAHANGDLLDPDVLKRAALQRMALDYRHHDGGGGGTSPLTPR